MVCREYRFDALINNQDNIGPSDVQICRSFVDLLTQKWMAEDLIHIHS